MQQDTSYQNIAGKCSFYEVNNLSVYSLLIKNIVYKLLSPEQNKNNVLIRAPQQDKQSIKKIFKIYHTLRDRLIGVSTIINKCNTRIVYENFLLSETNSLRQCIEIIFVKNPSQQEKQMKGFEPPLNTGDIITYEQYQQKYNFKKDVQQEILNNQKEEEEIGSKLFVKRFLNDYEKEEKKKDDSDSNDESKEQLWQNLESLVLQQNPHKKIIEQDIQSFVCNYKTLQSVQKISPEKKQQMEVESQNIFNNIKQKIISNKNNSTQLDKDLVRGLLYKTLRDKGHKVYITDEKIKESPGQLLQSQLIFTGQYDNCNYLQINIKDNHNLNYDQIMQNDRKKKQFIDKFIQTASQQHGVSPQQITITNIKKGSIEVDYAISQLNDEYYANLTNRNQDLFKKAFGNQTQLKIKSLLNDFQICADYFDTRFNMYWDEYHNDIVDYRGSLPRDGSDQLQPERYYFPVGYYGYGINVQKWLKDSSSWFGTSSSEDVWIVLYHGTTESAFKPITDSYLKPGYANAYGKKQCRLTGKIIPDGQYQNTYLTNQVQEAQAYSTGWYNQNGIMLDGQKYNLIFQCRVNPKHVMSPNFRDKYYTVDKKYVQESIRPYRVLIKKAQ